MAGGNSGRGFFLQVPVLMLWLIRVGNFSVADPGRKFFFAGTSGVLLLCVIRFGDFYGIYRYCCDPGREFLWQVVIRVRDFSGRHRYCFC